jgi:NTP pyrophosphatase (non-canonical NTP hydrolase)
MVKLPDENATLLALQRFHRLLDEEKGFDRDLLRNVAFLVGELGEMVCAIQDLRRPDGTMDPPQLKEQIGEELADVLAYVLKLANYADIDLQAAYLRKMRHNLQRSWPTPIG